MRVRRVIAAGALLLALGGCKGSTKSTLRFACDEPVNGGVLLTVDVVRGSEADVRRIRELGPDKWFYDASRNGLGDRLQTLTFPLADPVTGKCETTLNVKGVKEDTFLVVVADYKYETPQAAKQIIVFPKKEWNGKKLSIRVREKELTQEGKKKK